jgi:ADP-ribose pyrophosphatase YjhB (NUDIX family)
MTKAYQEHASLYVAVDCIIFGFDGTEIKALLVKRALEPEKGKWSLMGGFVGAKVWIMFIWSSLIVLGM